MVMQKQPLAEILRPHSLEGYIGQEHLMGEGAVLRTAIESGNIQSMIFWGPPGVGKTTLALLIAQSIDAEFFTLSAISRPTLSRTRSEHTGGFMKKINRKKFSVRCY